MKKEVGIPLTIAVIVLLTGLVVMVVTTGVQWNLLISVAGIAYLSADAGATVERPWKHG